MTHMYFNRDSVRKERAWGLIVKALDVDDTKVAG